MNVIVFGATGTIGKHLVEQSLAEEHTVTAFSRNPKNLELSHQNLYISKVMCQIKMMFAKE